MQADSKYSRTPAALAALSFALVSAYAWFESAHLLKGVPVWDQISGLDFVQRSLEGDPSLPARMGSGLLYYTGLKTALGALGGSAWGLFLFNHLILALECWLLFRRASKSFGPQAGLGAVLASLLSVFTLVRFRNLLSYTLLPLELLLLLEALELPLRPALSTGLGVVIGLLLADYEGWVAGLPILAFFWWRARKERRPRGPWLALGISAGLAMVIHASLPGMEDYLAQRLLPQAAAGPGGILRSLGLNLKSFFFGGEGDLYLGASPAFGILASPLLALGLAACWKQGPRSWLAWALLGSWTLATASKQPEAHRAIAAWPALCLVAGAGWARLPKGRAGHPLLLLTLAILWASLALIQRQTLLGDERAWQYWASLEQAADFLKGRSSQNPIKSLTDLNSRSMGEARLLFPKDRDPAAETWVLIPKIYAPRPLQKSWGEWSHFGAPNSEGSFYLLKASPQSAALFQSRHDFMRALWKELPPGGTFASMRILRAWLGNPGLTDPWLRRAMLDAYLRQAQTAHASIRDIVGPVLAEPSASPFALAVAASHLAPLDSERALSLARRSLAQDPDSAALKELVARLSALEAAPRTR